MKRLRNSTPIADDLLRAIEDFAMPPGGVGGYDLEVRNHRCGAIRGRAYYAGSGYHSTARPFIVLKVDQAERYPRRPGPPVGPGYLPQPWFAGLPEMLVFVFAHELRHLWQARVPRGRRVWGARGQFSERDADAYALKVLRAWRRKFGLWR